MKTTKAKIFWVVIGIILIPIILKLDDITNKFLDCSIIPFGLIGAYFFIYCIGLAKSNTNQKLKIFFSYICVLPLCLSIGEIVLNFYKNPMQQNCTITTEGKYTYDYFEPDLITGYKAKPNKIANSIRKNKQNNEVIYDVTYTTNDLGFRTTKDTNQNTYSKNCILLFGDSFTIGEGLNDNQTLSYFMQKFTHYKVFNFGFHGYGAHQSLALLKSGFIKTALQSQNCQNIIAFYESLPGHIDRVSAKSSWEDLNAPRFILKNNKLIWKNEHKNILTKMQNKLYIQIKQKSKIYAALKDKPNFNKEDNALFFAILKALDSELKTQFNARLNFLLWDKNNLSNALESLQSDAIIEWLNNQKTLDSDFFNAIVVSQILQDYKNNRLKYAIHSCDTHPNALANQKIAEFLAQKIKNNALH